MTLDTVDRRLLQLAQQDADLPNKALAEQVGLSPSSCHGRVKRLRSLGGPPILALTATATPRVREAIMQSLGLREPHLISSSPHRSNLAFEVIHCEGDMRLRALTAMAKANSIKPASP